MDNIEKIYKKTFKEFERNPKADFWDSLEKEIPPKPTKRKKGYFITFLMGVAITLLISTCHFLNISNQEVNSVQSFKIPMSNSIDIKMPSKETFQYKDQGKKNLTTTNNINATKKKAIDETKIIQAKTNSATSIKEDVKRKDIAKVNNSNKQFSDIMISKKEESKLNHYIPTTPLPLLVVDTLAIGFRQTALFTKRKKVKRKKKKILQSSNPYVAIAYTPLSISKFQINEKSPSLNLVNNSARIIQTKGGTVTIGGAFSNNWIVEISGSYHQFLLESSSSQLLTASFNNDSEQENGYLQNYSFNNGSAIDVVRGFATIFSEFGTLESGDVFTLTTKNKQTLKFFSLFQQVGYQLDLHPRFQFIPKVGLGITWAEKGKIEESIITLPDDRLELISSSIGPTSTAKSNLIEGVFSTEFAYHYSRNVHFLLTPQFRYGFKSFYENSQRSLKNRFLQIQVGVRVQL